MRINFLLSSSLLFFIAIAAFSKGPGPGVTVVAHILVVNSYSDSSCQNVSGVSYISGCLLVDPLSFSATSCNASFATLSTFHSSNCMDNPQSAQVYPVGRCLGSTKYDCILTNTSGQAAEFTATIFADTNCDSQRQLASETIWSGCQPSLTGSGSYLYSTSGNSIFHNSFSDNNCQISNQSASVVYSPGECIAGWQGWPAAILTCGTSQDINGCIGGSNSFPVTGRLLQFSDTKCTSQIAVQNITSAGLCVRTNPFGSTSFTCSADGSSAKLIYSEDPVCLGVASSNVLSIPRGQCVIALDGFSSSYLLDCYSLPRNDPKTAYIYEDSTCSTISSTVQFDSNVTNKCLPYTSSGVSRSDLIQCTGSSTYTVQAYSGSSNCSTTNANVTVSSVPINSTQGQCVAISVSNPNPTSSPVTLSTVSAGRYMQVDCGGGINTQGSVTVYSSASCKVSTITAYNPFPPVGGSYCYSNGGQKSQSFSCLNGGTLSMYAISSSCSGPASNSLPIGVGTCISVGNSQYIKLNCSDVVVNAAMPNPPTGTPTGKPLDSGAQNVHAELSHSANFAALCIALLVLFTMH